MEHHANHWNHSDSLQQAAVELHRMDQQESVLVEYETFVAQQQDTSLRIRSLLDLTNYYHHEFGVHFEKRHAYRDQLHRLLRCEVSSIDDARAEARDQYAVSDGLGLPRTERLARSGIAARY